MEESDMKKGMKLAALLLIVSLISSACGNPPAVSSDGMPAAEEAKNTGSGQEADATAQENNQKGEATGGTIRVGEYVVDTQMANKNPFATGTFTGMMKIIYEPLLVFNEIRGAIEPALAKEYVWNEDKTVLTFTMNESVKWQDGQPVTAEDAAYTMQILKDNPAYDKYGLWKILTEVKAEGNQLIFSLSKPFISLPEYLSQILIVPKHIWAEVDAASYTNENPIGTGPFIFKEYVTGTSITLDAFKDYWRGTPKADQMLITMYNTAPNCTLGLLKGEIDCTFGTIAMSSIPEFNTKENAKMDVYAGLGNFSVLINHENELLSDTAVRKAMAMAINQPELISKGEYNGVLPTSIGWLPDLFGDMVNEEAKNSLAFDLEGAKAVLEEAGYVKGKDGIYEKDGKRLSFTYHNASGAPAQQMEAGMIQQWLLNLGIEIIPKLATWPELTELAQTGAYDLLQMGINFPPDPYAALNTCFNSDMTAPIGEATPGLNYFRYRSDEMDALLAKAANEVEVSELKNIYFEIQDLLAKDYVFLPMYNSSGHVPYYDGSNMTGWTENNSPVISNSNLASLRPVNE